LDWRILDLGKNEKPLVAGAVATVGLLLLTALGMASGFFGWLFRKRSADPAPLQIAPLPPNTDGVVTLTLEKYEAQQEKLRERILIEMKEATGAERERLRAEKAAVEAKLANLETSYQQAQALIAELEASLARYGNELDPELVKDAEAALEAGDFTAAERLFERITDQGEMEVEKTATAYFRRGQIAEEQVRWPDAARHFARAADLAPNYNRLDKAGEFLWRTGRSGEAIRYEKDFLALAEREHGLESAETARALNNLAASYQAMGRYDEAEPLYRQAIEITGEALGTDHPDYAIRLNNLALLLSQTDRHAEAEPLFRRAMEVTEATIGPEHPDYAASLNNLAGLLRATGRYDEAEPLYRQAMEIREAALGTEHPDFGQSLNNLASLLQGMGRHCEAEPLHRCAMEVKRAALGPEHPDYGRSLNNLAGLLEATDRAGEARPLYAQMIEILRDKYGDAHPITKQGAHNYAHLLIRHGAGEDDAAALAALRDAFGPDIGRE
jgi:tetratricopeptide (TPR) repeat protein